MWLLSDHNVHRNSNSANNKTTTEEIAPEDKKITRATTTETDLPKTRQQRFQEW
jgi:hypothetical protein